MQQSLSTPKENDLSPSTEAANSDVVPQQPPVQPKMNERKCFFKKWETFVLHNYFIWFHWRWSNINKH